MGYSWHDPIPLWRIHNDRDIYGKFDFPQGPNFSRNCAIMDHLTEIIN